MMKKILFLFFSVFTITCFGQSKSLNLMPWPQKITLETGEFIVKPDFTIGVNNSNSERIDLATTNFLRRLSGRTGVFIDNGFAFSASEVENPSLEIAYQRIGKLAVNEDESYVLKVSNSKISIEATTDIGAIHALETLLQLLNNNDSSYYFPAVSIQDFPRFTWRGLMIDVARHFQPVEVLKRNLDAMSAVKMNVFHWHLTDDQGFRIESKTHPKLHQLGSDGLYYTQNQIKEVVKYASDRGIRVVPEVDVPGHATAILTAYPEIASKDTVYTIERFSGIFDPTLNPINPKTYEILGDLFGEMATLFPDQYVHIGGDENEGKHWDENEEIQAFMKQHGLETNHDLQTYFNIKLEEILAKNGKSLMGWEEIMTDKMPTSALIHSWKGVNEGVELGSSLIAAAKKGYYTILSNGFYIDLMQPVSEHYLVDPLPNTNNLTAEEKARILGGEATMWSELVTPLNIDSRLWPRTAAIAERFWSDASVNDVENMYKRLAYVNFRLEELGITQIRNRDVILRNITNNQPTESLEVLTKVCEPVKIYSRNAGGTEYKTFSPFTLFADACTVDAADSFTFKKAVNNFLTEQNASNTEAITHFFDTWIVNYEAFKNLKKNPILNTIDPLYRNLASISTAFKNAFQNENLSKEQLQKIGGLLQVLKEPVVDVDLAVYHDLQKLHAFLVDKNSRKITPKSKKIKQ
ncbi:beta-N-acetylhexosaminidase [Lutibacter sp. HS1-25]|uniref:beta-N-acetylhexosaminidase n=1 Tax=Lutibacter sp. HS1-25 TaxID=2485000 RepID=UPI0010103EAE|nr:family 20 glycosylhydrolase [Lutibacter sp. HS1-25]RXP57909.1 beta-N-acetylhexosaminidase [Lutibacter sp. HS1-25]